ncbi:MAG: hypothetical protein CM1200mP14_29080 [Gammaproteobacteria bacterium]|nr:MAG: hypothetical protein CM1200mP14_29080 [Gammaproteobacteria bacterium]
MLIEVRVQSLWVDGTTNTPVVMLKELSGERVLPIWIGPGEASAIATELAAMEFARPLTHDLLCTVMKQLGGSLQRVIISRVEDSTTMRNSRFLRTVKSSRWMHAPLIQSQLLLDLIRKFLLTKNFLRSWTP